MMPTRDELIEKMGKALYDRAEGLKGVWMPEVAGLCDKYFDFAEAALQALLSSLPGNKPITTFKEQAGRYQQLIGMKK